MRIIPYRKVQELDALLLSLVGEPVRFILPSRRDRVWWRKRVNRQDFGLGELPAQADRGTLTRL